MRILPLPLLLAAAAALAACAEPSGYPLLVSQAESRDSYGFSEERLDEELYRVSYVGPNLRTKAIRAQWVERAMRHAETVAYDLALWRAAQISLQKGYPAFRVTEVFADMRSHIVGRDYTTAFSSAARNVVLPLSPAYYSSTYFWPEATLTVELLKAAETDAFDARETSDQLAQKYAYDGRRTVAANTYYYFGPDPYFAPKEEEAPKAVKRPLQPPALYVPYGIR